MAASIRGKVFLISSQLSAISPRIIHLNLVYGSTTILRALGVRFCSNFKSTVVAERQINGGTSDEIFREQFNKEGHDEPEPEVPKWSLTRAKLSKRYAMQGKVSGVDPSIMWPTQTELHNIIKDEKEWCPSLQEMQAEIAQEEQAKELKRRKREELIAANMAKMPQMLAEHRKKVAERQAVVQQQQDKRNRLLEEARDKLGYAIDPRSTRFQKMVEEIEKEERKKKKELKKKGIVI